MAEVPTARLHSGLQPLRCDWRQTKQIRVWGGRSDNGMPGHSHGEGVDWYSVQISNWCRIGANQLKLAGLGLEHVFFNNSHVFSHFCFFPFSDIRDKKY